MGHVSGVTPGPCTLPTSAAPLSGLGPHTGAVFQHPASHRVSPRSALRSDTALAAPASPPCGRWNPRRGVGGLSACGCGGRVRSTHRITQPVWSTLVGSHRRGLRCFEERGRNHSVHPRACATLQELSHRFSNFNRTDRAPGLLGRSWGTRVAPISTVFAEGERIPTQIILAGVFLPVGTALLQCKAAVQTDDVLTGRPGTQCKVEDPAWWYGHTQRDSGSHLKTQFVVHKQIPVRTRMCLRDCWKFIAEQGTQPPSSKPCADTKASPHSIPFFIQWGPGHRPFFFFFFNFLRSKNPFANMGAQFEM